MKDQCRIHNKMQHPVLDAASTALGTHLAYEGDLGLLATPRRTLLVSRGERSPNPDTPWMEALAAAVRTLAQAGEILVTGSNRSAFDAALWLCAREQGAAIVALTEAPAPAAELRTFLPPRHLLVWPERPAPKATSRQQRDMLMGWLADRAYAIHVRQGGHMAGIVAVLAQRQCPVEPWPVASDRPRSRSRPSRVQKTFVLPPKLPTSMAWLYLTHYTREPDGAWPSEPRAEYLRWLCSGTPYTPRDAFGALCRILQERRLRACGRLMPDGAPMVCFTACSPREMSALRHWRRGLHRWTFTRYGLAIRKETLARCGARTITYASQHMLAQAPAELRLYMQARWSSGHDWSGEAEWRVAGDVDVSEFDAGDMLALVATPDEARHIQDTFGVRAEVIA